MGDAQPFVSVEDFCGGLFVGFLVGMNGASWVDLLGAGPDAKGPEGPASAASG